MAPLMDIAVPALVAVAVWWSATGLILYLNSLSPVTHRWSLTAAAVLAAVALVAVVHLRDVATPTGAAAGFLAAVFVWGLVEMAFLMGFVTGTRREPCPAGSVGWQRFRYAWTALNHHEVALAACLCLIGLLALGAPNETAFWTFALLWIMRLSTKLNIFLGVSNVTEEFLPEQVSYLKSYFRKAPMNALFPFSVTAATVLTYVLATKAADPSASSYTAMSAALLATFAALAVIEHWLLVLPLRSAALWGWSSSSYDAVSSPLSEGDALSPHSRPPSAEAQVLGRS